MKLLYDQIYMKKFRVAPQYSRLQTSLEGDALLPQTCTYWQPFGTAWLATVGVPLRHVKLLSGPKERSTLGLDLFLIL